MPTNTPNPFAADQQPHENWSPFQDWAQRLPGRLLASSDDGLLGTIVSELVEVSAAQEAAIWHLDSADVPIRQIRRPAEKHRPALEGQIGSLIRTERPASRCIRSLSAGAQSGSCEVLIVPLVSDVPVGWLVIVHQEGFTWSPADLATVDLVAAEIQRFRATITGGKRDQLQDLVAEVAGNLMNETAVGYEPAMTTLVGRLGNFFDVDVAYFRRNDHERRLSVMVAEWPVRVDVPDP